MIGDRMRFLDLAGSNGPRCTGNVDDDDGLSEVLLHAAGDDPADGVRISSRSPGYDHLDRPVRVGCPAPAELKLNARSPPVARKQMRVKKRKGWEGPFRSMCFPPPGEMKATRNGFGVNQGTKKGISCQEKRI
jgi:hypothetical protein